MIYRLDATPEDVVGLWLKMIKEVQPEAKPNADWWIQLMNGIQSTGRYCMSVAEDNDVIVGFCDAMAINDPVSGEVVATGFHIYVEPEYRKSVVADKLYRMCDDEMIGMGARFAEIQCFSAEKRFWERSGYKQEKMIMRRPIWQK